MKALVPAVLLLAASLLGSGFAVGPAAAEPTIRLEKLTNGFDADTSPGPSLTVGEPVSWTYLVTNTGDTDLSQVTVEDDQGEEVTCPGTFLAPGQTMVCTAQGVVLPGRYRNVGLASGRSPEGDLVYSADPSHYLGSDLDGAAVDIEKYTNGFDADDPPGPGITVGEEVIWTFVVTNIGPTALSEVEVSDDQLGSIGCPKTTLEAGESMTCTALGEARPGQHRNLARVRATAPGGSEVEDLDPGHYLGLVEEGPALDLEKSTNGFDADQGPGPYLRPGETVTWSYLVTNIGDEALNGISVTDDRQGPVDCPRSELAVGESMTCLAEGVAREGRYTNLGLAVGYTAAEERVSDEDRSHYTGLEDEDAPPEPGGPTVVVGGCDTGVRNRTIDGESLQEMIDRIVRDCAAGAKNHGRYVSCVGKAINDLKKAGLISGSEKGAFQSCAARSGG